MVGEFLTELDVTKVKHRRWPWQRSKWRLNKPLVYQTSFMGAVEARIEIPAGYVTDFASVPRVGMMYTLVGDSAHEGAVLHDWMYSDRSGQVPRSVADQCLYWGSRAVGETYTVSFLLWLGVRLGGWFFWYNIGTRVRRLFCPWINSRPKN